MRNKSRYTLYLKRNFDKKLASLKLAKDIAFPGGIPSGTGKDDDRMLDRMFYIAFRIEEYMQD